MLGFVLCGDVSEIVRKLKYVARNNDGLTVYEFLQKERIQKDALERMKKKSREGEGNGKYGE